MTGENRSYSPNSLHPSYSNLQRNTRLEPRTHPTTRVHDPITLVMSHQAPPTTTIPLTYHFPPYNYARLPLIGELFKLLSRTGESDLFALLRLITSLASFSGFVHAGHWPLLPPSSITGPLSWLDYDLSAPTWVMAKFPSFCPLIALVRLFPMTSAPRCATLRARDPLLDLRSLCVLSTR